MLVYLLSSSEMFKGKTKEFKLMILSGVLYGAIFGALWRFDKTKKYAKYLIPLFIADLVIYKLVISRVNDYKKAKLKKKTNKKLNSPVKPKIALNKPKTDITKTKKIKLEKEKEIDEAKKELENQKKVMDELQRLKELEALAAKYTQQPDENKNQNQMNNINDIINTNNNIDNTYAKDANINSLNEPDITETVAVDINNINEQEEASINIPIYRPKTE